MSSTLLKDIVAGTALTGGANDVLPGADGDVTVSIAGDGITDTQLAYDTGQHLTTTSGPTFKGLTSTDLVTIQQSADDDGMIWYFDQSGPEPGDTLNTTFIEFNTVDEDVTGNSILVDFITGSEESQMAGGAFFTEDLVDGIGVLGGLIQGQPNDMGVGVELFTINTGEENCESFEILPFNSWTTVNPDGGTGWTQVAVGTTPLPGWTGGEAIGFEGSGDYFAYCTWTTGGASMNDQYLITPQMIVEEGDEFRFYLFTHGADSYRDSLEILLSTATNDVADFTHALAKLVFVEDLETWNQYTYDLSAFAGESIYVAFREVVEDNIGEGAFIGLDMVCFGDLEFVGVTPVERNTQLEVYPNPAKNFVTINGTGITEIFIYNFIGQTVYHETVKESEFVVNTANFDEGLYIVKVSTEKGYESRKLIIE